MTLTRYAPDGAVAAANHLAATAGAAMLDRGGNAVDAVIAAAAVMSVTSPHMCGLGGDLFAMVAQPGREPVRARRGKPAARIVGPPGELLLYLFGRQSAAHVEVTGPDAAIEAVRRTRFGM